MFDKPYKVYQKKNVDAEMCGKNTVIPSRGSVFQVHRNRSYLGPGETVKG